MHEFVLITRDGCVACDRFKRLLDFERVPYTVKKINEDLSREDLIESLKDAGISSRKLPFVADREGNLMESDDFRDKFLNTVKRFDEPSELVQYLAGDGTFRLRFRKLNGTSKTIAGSIPPDTMHTAQDNQRISMYDETGESWNSFMFDRVEHVERIQ